MYKQSPNYGRLVIKSLLVLSLLRNWNKWWLVFQLAHRSLFNLQCIISSTIVPHCFQGKCVPTFQLDFKMSGTDLFLKEPPDSGRATFPLSDLAWPPPFSLLHKEMPLSRGEEHP